MPFSFPPCPTCGGTQAFFNRSGVEGTIKITFSIWETGVRLGALICLKCGHTELRPDPRDMSRLRAEVEKHGVLPPQ